METMKKLGLMTVAEAAEYLNVPRPTLYQHLREGHIPGIQIGGRWRIEQDKLNEFIGNAKRGNKEGAAPIMDEHGYASDRRFGIETAAARPSADHENGLSDRLEALRSENQRLRKLVTDQMLELEHLRSTAAAAQI